MWQFYRSQARTLYTWTYWKDMGFQSLQIPSPHGSISNIVSDITINWKYRRITLRVTMNETVPPWSVMSWRSCCLVLNEVCIANSTAIQWPANTSISAATMYDRKTSALVILPRNNTTYFHFININYECVHHSYRTPKWNLHKWKSSVSELQCQFQGMSPVIYAARMKVIHAFGGTFSVTEKVIHTFLYYYVMDNRCYI